MAVREGVDEGSQVETYAGKITVKWNHDAAVTPFGQLVYFVEFLKTAGLWESFVKDCPVRYESPNAPSKADMLGTILLSVLAGHKRYAHISALRFDGVNPQLLGMNKTCSEDSIRRAFQSVDESECASWLERHLRASYAPLLTEPWILDIDTTVKPLYGHQEGAVKGYNPGKPGRPSHAYHTYFAANIRLVLDVEVQPGNQTASSHAQPELWKFIDGLAAEARPAFIRGDCGWGTERMMAEAEQRRIPYLFKLKQTAKVKQLIGQAFKREDWTDAGQGFKGVEAELMLTGWTRKRRVIVLRRAITDEAVLAAKRKRLAACSPEQQLDLGFVEPVKDGPIYEYAVLVTTLPDEILTLAQHYRERAGAENNFDELKNQWGWGSFTTQELAHCRLMARMVAPVYNCWTLFVRLAQPHKHFEAISSWPLLLHGVATQHAGHTRLTITSLHAKQAAIQAVLTSLAGFLSTLNATAEQWTDADRLRAIRARAFAKFMLTTTGPPALPTSETTAI